MKKIFVLLQLLAVTFFATAQNVGIGISTPLKSLHIRNGASGVIPFPASLLAVESSVNTYINLLAPAVNETAILFDHPGNAANGVIMYNNPATPNGYQFRNNGNLTRMVLNNNGDVGIGTLNPAAKLHVSAGGASLALFGPGNTSEQLYVGVGDNQAGVNRAQVLVYDGNLLIDAAPAKKIYLGIFQSNDILLNPNDGGGNVGIVTNFPGQKLHINGNICYTGTIAAYSDIRYKINFLPISNALSSVLKMNGIYYNCDTKKFTGKDFSDARQIGFYAQEIEKLYP